MPTNEEIFQKLKNKSGIVEVASLFSSDRINGKLYLENIDFYRLGPDLEDIDFSDCIIKNCDFSFLFIKNCDFRGAVFNEHNQFSGCLITSSSYGIPIEQQETKKSALVFWSQIEPVELFKDGKEGPDQYQKVYKKWLKKYLLTYASDLLKFEELHGKASEYGLVRLDYSGDFFNIFPFREISEETEYFYGWKLHLSVHPNDLKQAFNLVAPLIHRAQLVFKVFAIDQFQEENLIDRHVYDGAQITIYLEENGKPVFEPGLIEDLVKKLDEILNQNNIRIGKIPLSDVLTKLKYFSLRNDKGVILCASRDGVLKKSIKYLPENLVGRNYNPENCLNPFKILLNEKKLFNPLEHFCAFNAKERDQIGLSFYMTLMGYIHEYTNINSHLEIEEARKRLIKCIEKSGKFEITVEDGLLKKEYQGDEQIKYAISLSVFLIGFGDGISCNNIEYFPYPYENSFKQTLVAAAKQFKALELHFETNDNESPYVFQT